MIPDILLSHPTGSVSAEKSNPQGSVLEELTYESDMFSMEDDTGEERRRRGRGEGEERERGRRGRGEGGGEGEDSSPPRSPLTTTTTSRSDQ